VATTASPWRRSRSPVGVGTGSQPRIRRRPRTSTTYQPEPRHVGWVGSRPAAVLEPHTLYLPWMAPAWRPPTLIGATAALLVLAVAFLPGDAAQPPSGPATIPDRMASYSYLTGSVSSSPPGRAVALFQHGFGVEFLDFPQAIVVGADGDVYRRLDEAEDRAGPETQGDPAPMLLSPQGTHVALGDHDTGRPELAIVNLTTGRSSEYPLPNGRSVVPLAWAPDGSKIAYLFGGEPTNPYSGFPITGDAGLLDVQTGTAEALPGATDVRTGAFSPDGTELALQHGALGGTLEVVSIVGASTRIIQAPGRVLDGPAAWSPDGLLLATTKADTCPHGELGPCGADRNDISFVDATGQGRRVPDTLRLDVLDSYGVLAWMAPDEIVVRSGNSLTDAGFDPETYWVTAVPLDGGDPRRLSAIPGGPNYGVGRFQLASGLLPDVEVRAASDVDRGPWPLLLRVAIVLLTGIAIAAMAKVAVNRQLP
jgi:hypothetical protein